MIQDHIGYAANAMVTGNGDGWQRERMVEKRVDRYKTFDAPVRKNLFVVLQEFWFMAVGDSQEEELLLSQMPFDPADDRRAVEVSDFLRHYSNHVGTFYSEVS